MNMSRLKTYKQWFPLVVTLGMFLVGIKPGFGQSQIATGTVTGVVTDASGGLIVGAHIALLSLETGVKRAVETNGVGAYIITNLQFGTYELKVDESGFSEVVVTPINLQVGQTTTVNIKMQPGKVTQEVEVSGSALRLETATSTLATVVTNTQIQQQATQTRNPFELVNLLPGVTANFQRTADPSVTADNSSIGQFGNGDYDAGGTNGPLFVENVIDGVEATQSTSGGGLMSYIVPPPDSVQEFSLNTSVPSAEYAHGISVVNMITKRGTNSFHGSLYEYNQNTAMNANSYFNNALGVKKTQFDKNQFGGSAGGPVYLPHIYDGKNRSWFFVNIEELRQSVASSHFLTVPTAAEMSGDFSHDVSITGAPITLYNPNATFVDSNGITERMPFPNNQIPASQINPFAAKVMSFFPKPNVPGGFVAANGVHTNINNFVVNTPIHENVLRYIIRLDQRLTDNQQLMVKYERDGFSSPFSNAYGNIATPIITSVGNYAHFHSGELAHTWEVTPTFIIQQTVAWLEQSFKNYNSLPSFNPASLGGPYSSSALLNYLQQETNGTLFPNITLGNGTVANTYSGFGVNGPNYSRGDPGAANYTLNMTKLIGRHELKWGFYGNFSYLPSISGDHGSGGTFQYDGMFTQGNNPLIPTALSGDPVADFELGYPSGGGIQTVNKSTPTGWDYAWYMTDNIKATPRLTFNLGIRYELTIPFTDRYNEAGVVNPFISNPLGNYVGPNTNGETLNQALGQTLMGGMVFAAGPNNPYGRRIYPTYYGGIGPRAGFAYMLNPKTVVRAGIGRIFMESVESAANNNGAGQGTFYINTPITGSLDGIHPYATTNNPFPGGFLYPIGSSQGLLTDLGLSFPTGPWGPLVTPYVNQFNVNIQRSLPANSVLSVAYAGTEGRRLSCQFCGEQLSLQQIQQYGSNLFKLVPNPFYGLITNTASPLSAPTVQQGQLLLQFPQFYGGSVYNVPIIQGKNNWPVFDQTNMEYPFINNWNALEVSYEIRHWHNIGDTLVAYTWSKDLTDFNGNPWGRGITMQNEHNPMSSYSLFGQDVPQKLAISHVIDLPFGRGQRFFSDAGPILNRLIGGWQMDGVATFQSGFPVILQQTPDTLGNMGGIQLPDLLTTARPSSGSRSARILQWFADPTGTFGTAPPFTYGNAPPTLGSVRSDPEKNYDFSLDKFININESTKLQIRGDFFNVFNRPWFAPPNSNWGSGSFGVVSSLQGPPRYVQISARIDW